MKYTVSQTAALTGVSVRTLHYYDEIGLLSPTDVSDSGYRYYDESALARLQQIMFYRELDFPLKEIISIMNQTSEQKSVLQNQRELLILKRNRYNKLIALIESSLKGEKQMSFQEFDTKEIEKAKEKYAKEVKEKWGNTSAYAQSQEKSSHYSKEDYAVITEKSNDIMKQFSEHLGEAPESPAVQALVKTWQDFITKYYYDCTKEILAGLGQMYVADERFQKNMDQFGEGTAKLMSDAIAVYTA